MKREGSQGGIAQSFNYLTLFIDIELVMNTICLFT